MSTVFESNGLLSGQDDHHLEANGHNTVDEDITNMSNGVSSKRDVKASNPGAVLPGCSPPTNKTDIGKGYAAVPLNDQPSLKPRKLRAIIIGAGYSGLTLAHKLRYQHPEMEDILTYKIFEARSDIGGTWLANTYPGVQCDVPAHIYSFPFDPNPFWSRFYVNGPEIHSYMKRTVKKWDLDRDVYLDTKVVGARWQEDSGLWKVIVTHEGGTREEYAEVLISGQGFLNLWKWPDIKGLDSFKGKKVHSADWDHSYNYTKKRIGVIGNGSSGIQIVPQLAGLEGTEVTSFQRGPTWVVSRMSAAMLLGRDDISPNPEYTEEDQRRFAVDPKYHNEYRRQLVHRINKAFRMFVKGSAANTEATEFAIRQMSDKLNNDPGLCGKLIPNWELGCRRVTPGEGYLESFLKPNVHLNQSPISHITEHAIHTADGQTVEVDVVVCATGFDVSHCPHYPVIGRGRTSLAEKWEEEPKSYLSLACPDFPNYFIFTGPNAIVGHGSLMEGLGWAAEYMIKWIKKIAIEDIKAVVPKQEAVDEFAAYGDKVHQTLTWTGGCRSWYKKGRVDGRVTAAFAGSALLFKELVSDIRGEDFEIQYRSPNRFRFLGNGFTEYELDDTSDLAWYIEK
ncbi:flavin-containing monooxygenase [Aspergillus puulaauensis]|uniref:FAD/NAD(P)-binding domain-containing protein n=1 Tax=Aspergillus puulaauensis TaxID=1220207 RepID=A0A7R7XAE9_9EURO|nr:uncharacterized protein APUU_10517S [Aspergillus puulaauensis]BCS17689.1 hypothetical protein APUU_10517S [Aspergillus puulaauensis]